MTGVLHIFRLVALSFSLVAPAFALVTNIPDEAGTGRPNHEFETLSRVAEAEVGATTPFGYASHVGMVGMGSGIYLGNGQVLTSSHVGCFPFVAQDGSIYEPQSGSWRNLKNEDGSKSDLAVFGIQVSQSSLLGSLGSLPLANSSEGRPVLLIGTGHTQKSQPIRLQSQGKSLGVIGYRVQPSRGVTWGLNRGSERVQSRVATAGRYATDCFATQFKADAFAGQATEGDSGGAAFTYNSELKRWELAGCIIAVSQQSANVTFGARTYVGDVTEYAAEILGLDARITSRSRATNRGTIEAQASAIR